ncbi:unnamed protein product [Rotaria magnacalcarata]
MYIGEIISTDTFSDCEVIELPNKNEHDIYDLGYNQNDSSIGKDQVDDQLEKLLNEIGKKRKLSYCRSLNDGLRRVKQLKQDKSVADQALVVDDDTQFHRATKRHNLSAEVSSLEFVEHRISSRSEMHFGT